MDIAKVVSHGKILPFADDEKIFATVELDKGAFLLQSDLDNLVHWCDIVLL